MRVYTFRVAIAGAICAPRSAGPRAAPIPITQRASAPAVRGRRRLTGVRAGSRQVVRSISGTFALLPEAWYAPPMTTTIDKAGRVVIPAEVRKRLGLTAGAELEMRIEGFSIRLVRAVAGPQLVRRGKRLVACPQVAEGERTEIDVARLIEEERDRWPG